MIGTTNCKIFDIEKLQTVKISVVTNQDDHSDLIGSTINVSYLDDTTQYVWDGNDITLSIPADVTYTISFSDVQGYLTPEDIVDTSIGDNSVNIIGKYKCELLTVNVTSDTGDIVNNFTIVISNVGELTSSNGVFKVPFGVTYTVSASKVDGFATPANQTSTAASQSKIIDVCYITIPSNGIYAHSVSNKFYTAAEWKNSNETLNGIAVITDNCKFVFAPERIKNTFGGYGKSISGLSFYSTSSAAENDYDGENNTAKIIAAIGNSNDGYRDGSAAGDCVAYTFPNGRNGYLGAAGEIYAMMYNLGAVNTMISELGLSSNLGSSFSPLYQRFWTSTLGRNVNYAWCTGGELTRNTSFAGDSGSSTYILPFQKIE